MSISVRGAAMSLATVMVGAWTVLALAQVPVAPAQQQFEAGQLEQATQSIAQMRAQGSAGVAEAFLAAHVLLKRNLNDQAKAEFAQLAALPDPVWKLVGESSTAWVDGNLDLALQTATQAVTLATTTPDPAGPARDFAVFYQLGLVQTRREDWAAAAEAFERASQLNPMFAYAHYYAGLAYSRIQRPDQVALHFEQFLKLAPNAPERAAAMSILSTLRGT